MLELQVPRGPVQPPRPTGRRVAEVGEEPQKGLWEKGFFLSSGGSHQVSQDGCIQIHPGAMEEEAVGRDALSPEGPLLAVPPAVCAAQGSPPYSS